MINRTQKNVDERAKRLADYQAGKTAGITVRSLTRWLSRAFRG